MAIKIYTVNEFNGDSDLYGGCVDTDNYRIKFEVALDTSDDTLIFRKFEQDFKGSRKVSSTTFMVEKVDIDQLIELLNHIKEGQEEVSILRKLSGRT